MNANARDWRVTTAEESSRLVFHISTVKCVSAIVGNDCNNLKYMIVNSLMQSDLPTLCQEPRTVCTAVRETTWTARLESNRRTALGISWDVRGSQIGSC